MKSSFFVRRGDRQDLEGNCFGVEQRLLLVDGLGFEGDFLHVEVVSHYSKSACKSREDAVDELTASMSECLEGFDVANRAGYGHLDSWSEIE